jgi:hypothetical protein
MYSTCIFCHSALGANEAIEHFPVGRRLAFDAAKGRLWAVCRSCERWNLSPIDERWEAIEECEKLFRDTRLRVSTDNIGLARLKEGTTLVRIGDPRRPEMAAWRYGDQFHRRQRKAQVLAAGIGVGAVGVMIAGPMMGVIGMSTINVINLTLQLPGLVQQRIYARIPVNGEVLRLNRRMLNSVMVRASERKSLIVEIPHKKLASAVTWRDRENPRAIVDGDAAFRVARYVLPLINHEGGKKAEVADAVDLLEDSRGADELFGRFAYHGGKKGHTLAGLRTPLRLALEMSLHEDDERRALEGELSILEDRWREAEEVAAISDDMFMPAGVRAMLKKLKSRS